jgi:hypothetical protein
MEQRITITFDNVSLAEANRLAQELQSYLLINHEVKSELNKETLGTQDLGAIVGIVLGSASIKAIVAGLSNWLLKKQSREITIKKNGDIIGKNLSSRDIENILKTIT